MIYVNPHRFGAGGGGIPVGGGTLLYLLNWDSGNGSTTFVDESTYAHAFTGNGGVACSSAQTKFGPSSISLDGSTQWLTTPHSTEWDCSTTHFTHGGWFYALSNANDFNCFINKDGVGSAWSFCVYITSGGKLGGYVGEGTGAINALVVTGTTTVTLNAWHHYEFVKVDTGSGTRTVYLFLDGNLEATGTFSGWSNTTFQPCHIGRQGGAGRWFHGYLDNMYGVKGYARNTASFTPPTAPITA